MAGRVDGGRGIPPGKPRKYPHFALMYVVRGEGRYRDRQLDLPLVPGSLVSVLPGHPHWYGVVGPGSWDEVNIVMDGPLFETCAANGLLDRRKPVRQLLPVAYWRGRIDRFRTARAPMSAAGADAEACDVVRLLVAMAAGEAAQDSNVEGGPYSAATGWLEASLALLADDLQASIDLPATAAAVGMGYESWRKRFAALTGQSPARFRLLRRIDAAADLMARTSLSNRAIASACGFSDEHHLSRRFREVTGVTTTAYRRSMG